MIAKHFWQLFQPADRFGTPISKTSISASSKAKQPGLTGVDCFNFLLSKYSANQILNKNSDLDIYISKVLKTDQIYSALDDFGIVGVFTLSTLPGHYNYVWRDELHQKPSQKFLIFTLDSNIYFVWLSFLLRKPKAYPIVTSVLFDKIKSDYSDLITKSELTDIDKLFIKDFELIIPHVNL